jgi:hypothetical protein
VSSSLVDDRLWWRSAGTRAGGGEEWSKAAVDARRGKAALHHGSPMRRTISGHRRRSNSGLSGQRSSVHDGSAWREGPKVAMSERSNGFRYGASDHPGRGPLIPARVDGWRPRGLGQGMAARWKNSADRRA